MRDIIWLNKTYQISFHLPLVFWQYHRASLPSRSVTSPTGLHHARRRCSECCPPSPPDAALHCLLGPYQLLTLSHLADHRGRWMKPNRAGLYACIAFTSALTGSLETAGCKREVVSWFSVCHDNDSTGDPRPSSGRGVQEVLCGEPHRFTCRGRHKNNFNTCKAPVFWNIMSSARIIKKNTDRCYSLGFHQKVWTESLAGVCQTFHAD